jgi:circadian clock protein KaiB
MGLQMNRNDEVKRDSPRFRFKLFVADDETNSKLAKDTLINICKKYLKEDYTIEVIDVLQDYKSALENKVFLAPTLIISTPNSQHKLIGSLSDVNKILKILGLSEEK